MITLIQIAIFVSYVVFLLVRFKKPLPSISESWYELVGIEKNLFTLFCFSIGFLMLFQMDGTTPLFFFSGAGIIFTGAAAAFKESMTRTVHTTGAIACIAFGLAALYFERGVIYPASVFCVVAFLINILPIKNRVWWIEILAFACIAGGLFIAQ